MSSPQAPRPAASGRRTLWWVAGAGLVAVALWFSLVRGVGSGGTADGGTAGGAMPAASATISGAPEADAAPSAPTRVCGAPSLAGPARAPAGAVVVSTSDRLDTLTQESPGGTTFWLEPGRHRLGDGEFSQVGPRAGNTYLGAPGAVLDGRRQNRYAFGGSAPDVTIEHLTIEGFGPRGGNPHEAVVNHDGATGWTISHVTVQGNAGAGVRIGDANVVETSCLADNGQYGFTAYDDDGVRDIVLRGSEITGNNTDDWEARQQGCGCTGGGKFWEVTNAEVTGNYVHGNLGVGLWADTNNAGFTISGNYVEGNSGPGLMYETSYNAAVTANTFVRNGLGSWRGAPGFPTAAVYVSESGSDPRVLTAHSQTFEIAHNLFVDNWGGVVGWENADRFAGSPADTSTGASTLVNPAATATTCSTPELIRTDPYIDDCRWKTQRLRVHDNIFRFSPGRVGPECIPKNLCGYSGLFSNFGSSPEWSPFHDTVVQDAITFDQDNVWSDNRYEGPWGFVVHDMGNDVGPQEWQAPPYEQDRGSTFDE